VFSPRPGKVIEDIHVALPEERKLSVRETETFGRYARHVRGLFENMGLLHD
jgi:NitT/TauT family transport system ATP-binding protein